MFSGVKRNREALQELETRVAALEETLARKLAAHEVEMEGLYEKVRVNLAKLGQRARIQEESDAKEKEPLDLSALRRELAMKKIRGA